MKEAIEAGDEEELTVKHIDQLCDELFQLKHSGHQFEQMLDTVATIADKVKPPPLERVIEVPSLVSSIFKFVFKPTDFLMSGVKNVTKFFGWKK